MSTFIALVFSGLAVGAAYSVTALGFLVLYKSTGVMNFAQGDLSTVSAFLSYWLIVDHDLPMVVGYLIAVAVVFSLGILLERIAYAPLRDRPVMSVAITTLGAALIMRSLLAVHFGTSPIRVPSPFGLDTFSIGGANIAVQRLLIIAASAVITILLLVAFVRTQFGRQIRALSDDRPMAQLLGIRTTSMSMVAWGVSAALSGLAGVLVAPLVPVDLNFGFALMFGAFAAAVLGGFGNFGGTVLAGMLLGLVEQVFGGYVGRDYKAAYPFILMVLVIAVRPQGIFSSEAERGRL